MPGVQSVIAAEPARWRNPPHFVALWELVGAQPGSPWINPKRVALDPSRARLAVVDQDDRITLIDMSGRWLARWGVPAPASGEPSFIGALHWTTGGQLAVLDVLNARLVLLRADGALRSETPLGPQFVRHVREPGYILRESAMLAHVPASSTVESFVSDQEVQVLLARDGWTGVDTVAARRVRVAWRGSDAPTPIAGEAVPLATWVDDTLIAVAGEVPELRIRILDQQGRIVRQVCRRVDPLPFSPEETELAEEIGVAVRVESAARIGRLFTTADGRIWVQRDRAAGPLIADHWFGPPGATFDVFESDGVWLGEVRAPAHVRVMTARGDTVVARRDNDDGTVSIVAYRLQGGS